MRQYLDAKAQHPDALMLFRMGDFYEVFFDDAVTVSNALDITLTARGKDGDDPIPMAGVPHHAAPGYIRRLVEQGFRVAICEQLEDPRSVKGIVARGVVRVITPGLQLDDESLDPRRHNYVAAVAVSSLRSADVTALAYLDLSTGELSVCEQQSAAELLAELQRIGPAEILVAEGQRTVVSAIDELQAPVREQPDADLSLHRVIGGAGTPSLAVNPRVPLARSLGKRELQQRFAALSEHTLRDRKAVEAACALLVAYLGQTQGGVPAHLGEPRVYRTSDFVSLDPASAANLEIFETLMGGRRKGSLISVVDETVTSAGGRRLRTWLSYPLVGVDSILRRQSAVSALVADPPLRTLVRQLLKKTADVQRVSSKLAAGQGNARDLVTLRSTLEIVPDLKSSLARIDDVALACAADLLDPCADVVSLLAAAIVDDPPVALNEGGVVRVGYDSELDELIELTTTGKAWLLRYEAQERERTGISSLKVKHNRVFGFYIEVTRANLESVPEDYIRKQTLANAERFFTPELKEYEDKIVSASDRRSALEYRIFEDVRGAVLDELGRIRATASALAEIDVLGGLAELSQQRGYCAPEIFDGQGVEIVDGRHPVVEVMLTDDRFVPNDTELRPDARVHIITGPNMAGKSTVIRQVALITLLAQIGSHVPARSAKIGVVDQIFSRVGASDNLARGQSTFMVEMSEVAHILSHASERSLIVLDEIGRGTATFDGLSIAWAVAEHLHDETGALALFATHYHELTDLQRVRNAARNFNIAVREYNDDIVFLRKLVPGPSNRSYGIQVARLAGVPDSVVARAKEVLANLEQVELDEADEPVLARVAGMPRRRSPQLSLFGATIPAATEPARDPIIEELASIPTDTLTPIEALNLIHRLQKRIRRSEQSANRR